jgi:hypothetical protein
VFSTLSCTRTCQSGSSWAVRFLFVREFYWCTCGATFAGLRPVSGDRNAVTVQRVLHRRRFCRSTVCKQCVAATPDIRYVHRPKTYSQLVNQESPLYGSSANQVPRSPQAGTRCCLTAVERPPVCGTRRKARLSVRKLPKSLSPMSWSVSVGRKADRESATSYPTLSRTTTSRQWGLPVVCQRTPHQRLEPRQPFGAFYLFR